MSDSSDTIGPLLARGSLVLRRLASSFTDDVVTARLQAIRDLQALLEQIRLDERAALQQIDHLRDTWRQRAIDAEVLSREAPTQDERRYQAGVAATWIAAVRELP